MSRRVSTGIFLLAVILTALFHLLHAQLLPAGITVDGVEYISLGDSIGRTDAATTWNYARTPIYPALLRAAFELRGHGARAVMIPNLLLGFAGLVVLADTLRRGGHPLIASIALLVTVCSPFVVTYEHLVLTEMGTFFFLAVLIALTSWQTRRNVLKGALLAATLSLGFYHRQTLIYLSPLVAVLFFVSQGNAAGRAVDASTSTGTARQRSRFAQLARRLALPVAIAVIPHLLAYPWQLHFESHKRPGFGDAILIYGLLKQAVPSPSDPLVANIRPQYEAAILEGRSGDPRGFMDIAGLPVVSHWALFIQFLHAKNMPRIFAATVLHNPLRYLRGVVRTTFLYAAGPTLESENRRYANWILTDADQGTFFFFSKETFPEIHTTYARAGRTTWLSAALSAAIDFARSVQLVAALATVMLAVFLVRYRNLMLAAFTLIPLTFLMLHAIILTATDRMAMPTWPILLFNLVAWPAGLVVRRLRLRNSLANKLAQKDDPIRPAFE